MNFVKTLENKIIKHDLINKYRYKNINELPKLKKIILSFSCTSFTIQKFATTILALEIIASKKSSLTTSKSANVFLKIQKGQPSGCKVVLKPQYIYQFLEKLILEILPNINSFSGFKVQTKVSTLSLKLFSRELLLKELENQYPLFDNLPVLDIHIITTAKNAKECLFVVKTFKIPLDFRRSKRSDD